MDAVWKPLSLQGQGQVELYSSVSVASPETTINHFTADLDLLMRPQLEISKEHEGISVTGPSTFPSTYKNTKRQTFSNLVAYIVMATVYGLFAYRLWHVEKMFLI